MTGQPPPAPCLTQRRLLLRATLALPAAGLTARLARAADLPAMDVLEFDWADVRRQRAVPVRLYWPSTAASAGPVPLVVFSHGIGGSRRGYSYLGAHWADHGIASLHLQHVGSDRTVWMGNPFGLVSRLQDAAQEREAIERPHDLRFALDTLLASPLGEHIDRRRIVAAGHSYGANTTLLAAGARVERQGRVLDLREERLAAAILISAPPFYGEPDPARILAPVTLPTLHVSCTGDVIRIPGYWSEARDRITVFEATGSRDKALAMFEGGSHSMFTDRAGTGGVQLNPQVKAATRELSLAFLRSRWGLGPSDALARWAEQHRPLLARFVA